MQRLKRWVLFYDTEHDPVPSINVPEVVLTVVFHNYVELPDGHPNPSPRFDPARARGQSQPSPATQWSQALLQTQRVSAHQSSPRECLPRKAPGLEPHQLPQSAVCSSGFQPSNQQYGISNSLWLLYKKKWMFIPPMVSWDIMGMDLSPLSTFNPLPWMPADAGVPLRTGQGPPRVWGPQVLHPWKLEGKLETRRPSSLL